MHNKKVLLLFFSFIFFFGFILLSKYEDRAYMRNLDFAVTVKIQEKIDSSAHLRLKSLIDTSMTGATFFASPEFTSAIVLLLTILFFKKYRLYAFIIPIAFLSIVGIELYAKSIVHHPSPPFSMIKHATSIFPANYINEQFSYPSGHAARAIFLAVVIFFLQRKKLVVGAAFIVYVLLVSVSRIYLGHHWFSDVLSGLVLGLAMSISILYLYEIYDSKTTSKN